MDDHTSALFSVFLRAITATNVVGKQKKNARLINQSNVSDIFNNVMGACIVISSWRSPTIHHLITSDWSHYLAGELPLGPPHQLP